MTYCFPDMRKSKTFKLDERILAALDALADEADTTANNYLETLLFKHCQARGHIAMSEPVPTGGRGGARKGAGRPKKEAIAPTSSDVELTTSTHPENN